MSQDASAWPEPHKEDLEQLFRLLCGEPADDFTGRLSQERNRVLRDRWNVWWCRNPSLQERWERLGPRQRERLDQAPEVWTMLTGAKYGEFDLARWIDAEEGSGGWSALGDRCGNLRAPKLETGTIVDWQSPTALGSLPEIRGDAEAISESQAEAVQRNLRLACGILRETLPNWVSLVQQFDTVLLIRNTPSLEGFNSASTRLALGRPVLRNAHLSDATPEAIADGLVHETVHTVVDHLELTLPFTRDVNRLRGSRVVSGWSGRPLDVNTFVHASLVWFALFNLWLTSLKSGAIERDQNVQLLTSRGRGFLRHPAAQLEPYADALFPGIIELVQQCEKQVLALVC